MSSRCTLLPRPLQSCSSSWRLRFSQKCYWRLGANICSRTGSSAGLRGSSPHTELVFATLGFGQTPPASSPGSWRTLELSLSPKRKAAAPGEQEQEQWGQEWWDTGALRCFCPTWGVIHCRIICPATDRSQTVTKLSNQRMQEIGCWLLYTHNFISKDKCSKSMIDICKDWVRRVMGPGRVPGSFTALKGNNSSSSYTFRALSFPPAAFGVRSAWKSATSNPQESFGRDGGTALTDGQHSAHSATRNGSNQCPAQQHGSFWNYILYRILLYI